MHDLTEERCCERLGDIEQSPKAAIF